MSGPADPTAAGPGAGPTPVVHGGARRSSLSLLVGTLERKGLELFVEQGEVRYRGDEAGLRSAEFEEVRSRKDEVLDYLRDRSLYETIPPLAIAGETGEAALSTYQTALLQHRMPAPRRTAQYRLLSELDVEKLETALDTVLNRYEVLRSRFLVDAGEWRQKPLPSRRFAVELVESEQGRDPEDAVETFLQDIRGCRLALAAGEVLRVFALRLAEADNVVAFVAHPAAMDQRSWPIVAPQVFNRYFLGERAEQLTRTTPLEEGAVEPLRAAQFSDFVRWERRLIDGAGPGAGLAYWDERLAHVAPLFEGVGSTAREKSPIAIPPNVFLKIIACARDYGLPAQALVFGCFAIALMWRLDRPSVALGYDLDNRPRGAEYLVGALSGPRPFLLHRSEATTFEDLLNAARFAYLSAIDLRHPVGGALLDRAGLWRSAATVFSRPEVSPGKRAYSNFSRLRQRDAADGEGAPSLTVAFVQTPVELRASLEFDPACLAPADAAWIRDRTERLLDRGPGDPHQTLADLLE